MKVFLVIYITDDKKLCHLAFIAMENKVDLQCYKIVHLENPMVMYGIYNSETLEKLMKTVYKMHNTTTWNEIICQKTY